METLTLIMNHAVEILEAILLIVTGLIVFAKWTPNQTDDNILAKLQDWLDNILEYLKSRRE